MFFASVNQLEFQSPSRRDDLISLCYLLVYLVNDYSLCNVKEEGFDLKKTYRMITKMKKGLTPLSLCEKNNAQQLIKFCEEVFSYEFSDKPDYLKLQRLLIEGFDENEQNNRSVENL